ncbi:MAG: helix-turn-helix domain-containing protein [wastewater metagenome]|nr:helix-turn-helix domain-containing protein [Candidatus Loosdrechtia aerotolerans]
MPKQTILTRKVDIKRLKTLLRLEKRKRIKERLQSILWIHTGEEAQKVAIKIGRCRQSIASYVKQFNQQGIRGLLHMGKSSGRKPVFTKDHRARLIALVRKSPRSQGYSFNFWNCKKLSHHVYQHWGIKISDERIRQILREHGVKALRPGYKRSKSFSNHQSKNTKRKFRKF